VAATHRQALLDHLGDPGLEVRLHLCRAVLIEPAVGHGGVDVLGGGRDQGVHQVGGLHPLLLGDIGESGPLPQQVTQGVLLEPEGLGCGVEFGAAAHAAGHHARPSAHPRATPEHLGGVEGLGHRVGLIL